MFDDLWLVPRGKKKLVLPYEARPDASPIRAGVPVSFGIGVVSGQLPVVAGGAKG